MKRDIVAAGIVAVTVLAGCGSRGPTSFDRYAQSVLDKKVTAENVTDDATLKGAVLAITCTTWASATDEQREKAPAQLAANATEAGYESSADDALAYLDANCTR